jgi:hypothetical protein
VSKYRRAGEIRNDPSHTAGMIYMDVCEHNIMDIIRPQAGLLYGGEQSGPGRHRPRIDDSVPLTQHQIAADKPVIGRYRDVRIQQFQVW